MKRILQNNNMISEQEKVGILHAKHFVTALKHPVTSNQKRKSGNSSCETFRNCSQTPRDFKPLVFEITGLFLSSLPNLGSQ